MSDSENEIVSQEEVTKTEENDSSDVEVEEVNAVKGSTNPSKLTDEERKKRKRERERERRKRIKDEMSEKLERLKELEQKHKKGRPKKGKEIEKPITTKTDTKVKQEVKATVKKEPVNENNQQEKRQETKVINRELKKYESGDNPYLREFARSSAFLKASLQQFKRSKSRKNEKKKLIGDMLEEKFRGFMKEYIQAQKQMEVTEKKETEDKKGKRKRNNLEDDDDTEMSQEDYIKEQQFLKKNHKQYNPNGNKRVRIHPLLRNNVY